MRVVIVEQEKAPAVQTIENGLTAMQTIVGGTIQAIYPFEEPIALICNDEGKLHGLPLNRALRDSSGTVYDIVSGTFLLCAAPADSDCFDSLTYQQIQFCMKRFAVPEYFVRLGSMLLVLSACDVSQ